MSFIENVFQHLETFANRVVMQEIHGDSIVKHTGSELLELVRRANGFVSRLSLRQGDRCALLAPNSIRWAAADLALMNRGIIVVPLYARQAPAELAVMIRDSCAAQILCGTPELRDALLAVFPDAPPVSLFDEIFAAEPMPLPPQERSANAPVTIIYTSGTSGEPKGVPLTIGNLDFMLDCTTARLDQLMGRRAAPEEVFHYGPFSLAASWVLLLSCLLRNSVLSLSTDVSNLAAEMRTAKPQYMLNVPLVLERVRRKIEEQIHNRDGWIAAIFSRAQRAYFQPEDAGIADRVALAFARRVIFPLVRKSIGSRLEALICGSAPLAIETQEFFLMLGIKVLQVYGLTETTAICTMDDPAAVEPGFVGPAIPGIEMKVGEAGEILVRGPNIFPGYWNRPEETAKALCDGWFHTGDQGEISARGNWKITGRTKNLIVLNSGHNIAPEPLENRLAELVPEAQQAIVIGDGRSHLVAIFTANGNLDAVRQRAGAAINGLNENLPHYRKIRAYHVSSEPFTADNGMLTLNGKLRREEIAARLKNEIDALYGKRA